MTSIENDISILPPDMQWVHKAAFKAIGELEPAGSPKSDVEPKGLMLSSRTNGGRNLPDYYLVYFLLVDLLGFPKVGQWEKVAWTVPIRYRGRLYGIEHRKMGLGIFAPNLDPDATRSTTPSDEAEADAREIATLITKAVSVAEPYFEWRAKQAASGSELNVLNNSSWLFDRYKFFLDRYKLLSAEAEHQSNEIYTTNKILEDSTQVNKKAFPPYLLRHEAEWNAQAAVEAFFSWTEHAFIHLAILQGKLCTGDQVASLANTDWKTKFRSALDISDIHTKKNYDNLLDLRMQIRNFMAHGAFGKRGEAFKFHSDAGAVPVLLTSHKKNQYSLTGKPAFDECWAIEAIEQFVGYLWTGPRLSARHYIFSSLPSILTFVIDGTYSRVMKSEIDMKEFVEYLTHQFDSAANMEW